MLLRYKNMRLSYILKLFFNYIINYSPTCEKIKVELLNWCATFLSVSLRWKVSKYGLLSSPYSVRKRKIRIRKCSIFGHFSRSAWNSRYARYSFRGEECWKIEKIWILLVHLVAKILHLILTQYSQVLLIYTL